MWQSVIRSRRHAGIYPDNFRIAVSASEREALTDLLNEYLDEEAVDAVLEPRGYPADVDFNALSLKCLRELVAAAFEEQDPRADWTVQLIETSAEFLLAEFQRAWREEKKHLKSLLKKETA
jgi:hypothetical protein